MCASRVAYGPVSQTRSFRIIDDLSARLRSGGDSGSSGSRISTGRGGCSGSKSCGSSSGGGSSNRSSGSGSSGGGSSGSS